MGKQSAGILLYRLKNGFPELFLVHPGGPFWARKDAGAWSVPKGEYLEGEDALEVAKREFQEETGSEVGGALRELTPVRQAGGKKVRAWAVEGDLDAASVRSNTFTMEWPPGSGRQAEFPEVDRAGWFTVEEARAKILQGQRPLLDELLTLVA